MESAWDFLLIVFQIQLGRGESQALTAALGLVSYRREIPNKLLNFRKMVYSAGLSLAPNTTLLRTKI